MDRKDFIRKGFLGSAIFSATGLIGNVVHNKIDELKELEIIGFNHLPNTNSTHMENSVLHKANTRGHANHGWLDAHHSFSFANYYNPERMHFGTLRVLNDDIINGGEGFGTHPHDNMEIITIPMEGAIEHKDSMGNSSVIHAGEIQVMSAGTGITHSEFNHFKDNKLKLLQIWIFPNHKGVTPRYDQLKLDPLDKQNKLQQILSPNPEDAGVWIHQNAWFHLGHFDKDKTVEYKLKDKTNGIYAFIISGQFKINGQQLDTRDGFGIWDISSLEIQSASNHAEILLMEVPMGV
jgi:redox-sensitive bicupin YhaK (pirin superfamily)